MSAERGLVGKFLIALVARVQGIGVGVVGVLPQQLQRREERVAVSARQSRCLTRVPRLVKDIGVLAVEVQLTHVALEQLRHRVDVETFA